MNRDIEHKPFEGVRIEVATSVKFDEVLTRLRSLMGHVNPSEIVTLAQSGITETEFVRAVQERFEGESGFMLFAEIDHGGWLSTFQINRRTVRWILGNPLIAVTMIRHDITAGLFAPVEILVTETEDRQGTMVTYVRPSSLMVIEENPPLLAMATLLDAKFDSLIARATQQ
ncbi:DUF302 domain-containing protein [Dyella japonica]|uniref:Uncharacterized protein (DUF302 family) n=1 Tax=Dyella japonica TaxID=231455 RepID=A0ABV2JS56_9GAMM